MTTSRALSSQARLRYSSGVSLRRLLGAKRQGENVARVFISSTTEDLTEHRQVAIELLHRMGHEVVVYEVLGASDDSPLQESRALIASCDLFVGLIGWRYGFVPPRENAEQRSFVELEHRYAWELGKPTLVFMTHEGGVWPRRFMDDGESAERVKAFRAEIRARVAVSVFATAQDLLRELEVALARWQAKPRHSQVFGGVDVLDLAFRLVLERCADPALLRHMDPDALSEALHKWASQRNFPVELADPRWIAQMHRQLREVHPALEPSPLWVAWMRTTRSHLLNGDAGAPPRSSFVGPSAS